MSSLADHIWPNAPDQAWKRQHITTTTAVIWAMIAPAVAELPAVRETRRRVLGITADHGDEAGVALFAMVAGNLSAVNASPLSIDCLIQIVRLCGYNLALADRVAAALRGPWEMDRRIVESAIDAVWRRLYREPESPRV